MLEVGGGGNVRALPQIMVLECHGGGEEINCGIGVCGMFSWVR